MEKVFVVAWYRRSVAAKSVRDSAAPQAGQAPSDFPAGAPDVLFNT
jgi:hypothetical protein